YRRGRALHVFSARCGGSIVECDLRSITEITNLFRHDPSMALAANLERMAADRALHDSTDAVRDRHRRDRFLCTRCVRDATHPSMCLSGALSEEDADLSLSVANSVNSKPSSGFG